MTVNKHMDSGPKEVNIYVESTTLPANCGRYCHAMNRIIAIACM